MDFLIGIIMIGIGIGSGYGIKVIIDKKKLKDANKEAERIINEAKLIAEKNKKEKLIEMQEEFQKERKEQEAELRRRQLNLEKREELLLDKEKRMQQKEIEIQAEEIKINEKKNMLKNKEEELRSLKEELIKKLEEISGITAKQAKELLLSNLEEEIRQEATSLIKRVEEETKEIANKKAKELITEAMQRCAATAVAENTITTVSLPDESLKGRIIGREGRNVRTLETLTGVEILIDDTPTTVVISGYCPLRREVARLTLERLIKDGRINPSRIEEVIKQVEEELNEAIRAEGERVSFDLGVHNLSRECIMSLGKLKYRTSFGQNLLLHSQEVTHIASVIAAELGADVKLVKRAALLHDIGKSIDSTVEGPHAFVGGEIARKAGEDLAVVHAIRAHHNEEPPQTIEAIIIQIADTISAARPGARKESLEAYIKRMEKLEKLANSFSGVEKAYAIQAGREVRVIVAAEKISDEELTVLARNISKKIEEEVEYPGQIKITAIREKRVIEYTK